MCNEVLIGWEGMDVCWGWREEIRVDNGYKR